MTIMQLFFQAMDPADGTVDAARRRGFVERGCVGVCIYLVEHPSLLIRDTDSTNSSGRTTIFSCTADLGTIARGRRFESSGQLTKDALSMCGADSLLLSGRYWEGAGNATDDDEMPEGALPSSSKSMVARPRRFFAMLDASRLSSVVIWPLGGASSHGERLEKLPSDTFFAIVDGPVANQEGIQSMGATTPAVAIASGGPWFTKSIAWVLVKERLASEIVMHAQRMRRALPPDGGRSHAMQGAATDVPFVPTFHVVGARIALGTVDATCSRQGTTTPTPTTTSRVDTRLRITECSNVPFLDKQALDCVLPPRASKGASAEGDAVIALRHAMLHKRSADLPPGAPALPTATYGYELLGVRDWKQQCVPLQLPEGTGSTPEPRASTVPCDGVSLGAYAFLLMCHPTKAGLRDHPYFLAVNNFFQMSKKKYGALRLIERFGVGHVVAVQQLNHHAENGDDGGGTAAGVVGQSTDNGDALPTPSLRVAPEPLSPGRDGSAMAAGTAPLPPSMAPVSADLGVAATASGSGGRELVVLWDVDSVTPRNPLAYLRALLRVLSIQDLHEQWGCRVVVHLYLDSVSFADAAALLQQLVGEVECTIHPVPHHKNNEHHTVAQLLTDAEALLGLWSSDRALTPRCPSRGVAAILTGHTSHPTLASICTRSWGSRVEGVVLCASDTTPCMLSWHAMRGQDADPIKQGTGSRSDALPHLTRLLLLEANLETMTFCTVAEASAHQKRTTHDSKLTPRRSIIAGPVPDGRPPEITIAEVALLDNNGALSSRQTTNKTANLADKPYAHLLVPLMHMLWELQQQQESVDILLRELFACIRDRMEHMGIPPAGTELMYSAFHTLVNRGWLKPGFGKNFHGRVFQRAVCWTCFASNIPRPEGGARGGGSPTHHPMLMQPPKPTETEELPAASPTAATTTPQLFTPAATNDRHSPVMTDVVEASTSVRCPSPVVGGGLSYMQITDDDDDDDLLALIAEPPAHERVASADAAAASDPFSTATLTVPRRVSSVRAADAHDTICPSGEVHASSVAVGPLVVPMSLLEASDLLDTFSLDVCGLQSERQWMPTEVLAAKQEGRVDHLRVLIALMTLQRQHGAINVSMWALLDRCVTLERIVICMQGDLSHGGGSEDSYAARYAAISGIPGGVAVSRLNRDVFVQDIEAAIATRVVARLSDGSLCFVSDVHLSLLTVEGDESLITAVCDGRPPSAPRSPPEISHIFTMQSLHRLLMARALRDEQYVVFPQLAVHMRKVRVRWHELCVRHGLVPSAPLWESVRMQMERARMVHVFSVPSSQFTWMMFWSDVTAIRFVSCCAHGSERGTRHGSMPAVQAPLQPYYASGLDNDDRLWLPSHPQELRRESFRRDVQLFPRELMFAVQQDSLNEHYLLMLHALQKLQRSVVVDAIVCDYLVARFLLQSPSGALLEQHTPTTASLPHLHGGASGYGGTANGSSMQTSSGGGGGGNVWSRVMETQSVLAAHRLVYVSGSDIAFGSDYVYHVPHYARLVKQPRQNVLEQDPVELQHDAAILDPGVRLLLDGLMHMQRLLRRTKVSWTALSKVLAQQVPVTDRVHNVLERCLHAGLVRTVGSPWPGSEHVPHGGHRLPVTSICFTSDAYGEAGGNRPERGGPPPQPSVQGSAAPPPYVAVRTVTSSKPLNPLSKPFEASSTGSGALSAAAPPADTMLPGTQQLPASVALLEGLTAPTAAVVHRPHGAATDHRALSVDTERERETEVVPLSSLSRRSRVVRRTDEAKSSSKSVLSQLFLTLERLEARSTVHEEDQTSCGSSARDPTPAFRDTATPTAARGSPTSTGPQGGSTGPGSRFISALTWLFESALEEVSSGPKAKNAASVPQRDGAVAGGGDDDSTEDEQCRRRRLYYSTLAAFFDTAANGDNPPVDQSVGAPYDGMESALDDDDDDDGLVWREPKRREKAPSSNPLPEEAHQQRASCDADGTTQQTGDGIVVPCRNRPQLSHAQKRAMRQLHAKLTQASMTEDCQDAEPWESVKFFFAKAEVIAGISL